MLSSLDLLATAASATKQREDKLKEIKAKLLAWTGEYSTSRINCALHAFRAIKCIEASQNLYEKPAPDKSGNLFTYPESNPDGSLRRSYINDPRILKQIMRNRLGSKKKEIASGDPLPYIIIEDEEVSAPVPSSSSPSSSSSSSTSRSEPRKLYKANTSGELIQQILELPGREDDNIAYGYLFFEQTHDKDEGHVIIFYREDGFVLFIDKQEKTKSRQISEQPILPVHCHREMFYMPVTYPLGYRIKQEPMDCAATSPKEEPCVMFGPARPPKFNKSVRFKPRVVFGPELPPNFKRNPGSILTAGSIYEALELIEKFSLLELPADTSTRDRMSLDMLQTCLGRELNFSGRRSNHPASASSSSSSVSSSSVSSSSVSSSSASFSSSSSAFDHNSGSISALTFSTSIEGSSSNKKRKRASS